MFSLIGQKRRKKAIVFIEKKVRIRFFEKQKTASWLKTFGQGYDLIFFFIGGLFFERGQISKDLRLVSFFRFQDNQRDGKIRQTEMLRANVKREKGVYLTYLSGRIP